MNEKVNSKFIYRCNFCDKIYASASSLCNHNKKFHSIIEVGKSTLKVNNEVVCGSLHNKCMMQSNQKKYKCNFCNREFNDRSNKSKHEKICKKKDNINDNLEIKKMELRLKIQEQEIIKLKLKLATSKKADTITLKQLNKLLIERQKEYQNYINNINNGTIYNGSVHHIVNNIQLVGFGKENDILETLTNKEKKQIMDSRYKCLEKFIEIVHCGNYDKFKNIIVTNMKDNFMYKYDEPKGQFILATKDDTINSLIDNRMYELETIYDELLEKNKLDDKTKDIIEKFINKLNNDDSKYTDSEGHVYDTYKKYKINEIKLILYNNKDKITNDISLLLTTSNVLV